LGAFAILKYLHHFGISLNRVQWYEIKCKIIKKSSRARITIEKEDYVDIFRTLINTQDGY